MSLSLPPPLPLRPGETLQGQREQLERLALVVTVSIVAKIPLGQSQAAPDDITRQIATQLQTALAASGLFTAAPLLHAHVLFNVTKGEPIRLPMVTPFIVPVYAVNESSHRLCALTGALAALGLRISFYSWGQAKEGISIQ